MFFGLSNSPLSVFLALLTVTMGLGCAHKGVEEDRSLPPILANDTTLFIEGCGHQPINGYTYCREYEGRSAEKVLVFHLPPAKCQKTNCVYVKILMPDGSPAEGFALKEGETRLEVSWKTLLKREVFQAGDRGFWIVLAEVHYINSDGILKKSLIEGEIRLRVLKIDYSSLHNVTSDPNFVWQWQNFDRQFKMTSNGRSNLTFMGGRAEVRRDRSPHQPNQLGLPPLKEKSP